MVERRGEVRRKSLLRGRILFNNNRSIVDCLIREISSAGARLVFSDSVGVPDAIELHIPQKEQTLHAHVQWRHGQEVGISFAHRQQPPLPARSGDGELATRVQRLEAEVTALRRMLRQLKLANSGDEAA
jgi:hypothetical protein